MGKNKQIALGPFKGLGKRIRLARKGQPPCPLQHIEQRATGRRLGAKGFLGMEENVMGG
jgi:hypothetical protein